MTRDETKELLMRIDALYPNWNPDNLTMVTDAWAAVLKDFPKEVIDSALIAYVTGNQSGFAPSVSQLLGVVKTAQAKPLDVMTPLEAWSLVYKAIGNSIYDAEGEFQKLPEICQKAIGRASNLREMANMETETVESVEQSHFISAYKSLMKRQEEYDKIPVPVRDLISGTTQKMLEG